MPVDRLERLHILVAHQVRDRLVLDAPVVHDRRERVPHAVDVELAEPGITEDDLDAPPEPVFVERLPILADRSAWGTTGP